ncbi:mechanosensitive ion channel domain-containing protein [Parachlamydia sp. AcF125]|uniref:mechanosensitive ion channel domain-containing protein n=1 Tax=Parachlamydia sp. AcF125 TaxID=2795736 RepID=UPI001BC9D1C2|nr:mechanosensitive ion channel domain-containing protein [Parachlamydia sp. AcF125]MBS4168430.1 putative MscS family protein.1 [Parachlamydia sp. AcF125]
MRFFLPLYLIFSLALGSLAANDPEASPRTEILDPANLSSKWWDDFERANNAQPSYGEDFFTTLKKQIGNLSPENQEEAQKLLESIKNHFQNLKETAVKAKPTEIAAPIASTYSIDRLVDIHHALRKNRIEMKITEEDRDQKTQLVQKIQEKVDKLVVNYDRSSPYSEAKFLQGLEWIAARMELEANKKDLEILNQNYETVKTALGLRKNEEDYAKQHLVSSHTEVSKFEHQMLAAQKEWEEKKQILSTKDASFMTASLLNSCNPPEVKKQLNILQGFSAAIEEAGAQLRYIQTALLLNLSQLVTHTPDENTLATFDEERKKWKTLLNDYEKVFSEWRKRAEGITQRNEQILCLKEPAPENHGEDMRQLHDQLVNLGKKNLQQISNLESELSDASFLLESFEENVSPLLAYHPEWIKGLFSYLTSTYSSLVDSMGHTLFYVGNYPVTIFSILRFITILFLTFWISNLVVRALTTLGEKRRGVQQSVLYRVNRLIYYLILLVGTLVAFSSIGFDFSNLLLVAGALGVGLGFGLQSIFNNFVSGLIILFESNLKIGDVVQLENGVIGEVRAINVRSTILRTGDGIEVLVPNAELVTTKVTNWTLSDPFKQLHIPFSVAYGTDKERVRELITAAAKKEPMTLLKTGIPEPAVFLTGFGEYGMKLELAVWIDQRAARKNMFSTYLEIIETVLREHHITMPYPQHDVRILSMPESLNATEE